MWRDVELLKDFLVNRARGLPSKLNLNLTSRCNSRCLTCRVWEVYKDHPEKSKDELTFEEIKEILRSSRQSVRWLTITGGEPFLRPDLAEILAYVIDHCRSLRLLSIPTNGLAGSKIIQKLKNIKDQSRIVIFLTFSLDGPPEIHDMIRGIPKAFEKTWAAYNDVRKLLSSNALFRIGLETTISKYNILYLKEFFNSLIADHHSLILTIAHQAYQYRNEKYEKLLPNSMNHAVVDLIKSTRKNTRGISPEKILKRVYLDNCVTYIRLPMKRVLPCTALQNSVAVDPYGNVYPCTMWNRPFANLRDYGFDLSRLWAQSASIRKRIVKEEIERGLCPTCWTPCEAYQCIAQCFYYGSVLKGVL